MKKLILNICALFLRKRKNLNPYILLVMKWVIVRHSISKKKLEQNKDSAQVESIIHQDKDGSYRAAYRAACYAYESDIQNTGWSVNEYFRLTGENKQDYIDAIKEELS